LIGVRPAPSFPLKEAKQRARVAKADDPVDLAAGRLVVWWRASILVFKQPVAAVPA